MGMGMGRGVGRTVVLAGSVEYAEEGLFAVDEALFDVGVLDSWKPLEGKFVLDESDLRREARGQGGREAGRQTGRQVGR